MRKDDLVDYDPDTGRCRTTPRQLFLELTPRCNLACVHCPKDYGLPWPGDLDMSRATLERLRPWITNAISVNLNLVGEPLIADQFDHALALCAEGTAAAAFNTNGLALTDARCDQLVAARVDWVVMSVDGLETNATVRGVPFATIEDRLARLQAAKERAGSDRPHLGIAYTLMRRNLHELPRMLRRLLPRVRLEAVHLQPLIVFWESLRGQNVYQQFEVDDVVRRSAAIAAPHGCEVTLFRSRLGGDEGEGDDGERLQLGQRSRRFGCSDPFYEVKVLASGRVQSCSWGLSAGLDVGTTPLDEIWNGEWYRALRKRLYRGEFTSHCTGCPYVFGSAANQETPLVAGRDHSRAAAFRVGVVGRMPTALPEPVVRPFLTGAPARPRGALYPGGEQPPRALPRTEP